jgi:GNAT superfamily N-acetyltransferase
MRVWRAGPGDASRAAELLIGFRDHMGRSEPPDASFHATVARLIATPDTEYLLAAADDGPAEGVVQLRFRWTVWWDAEDCWLEDLFVTKAARGTGLGRALVEAAIAHAGERGCRRVDLDVEPDNPPARRLYESLGFAPGRQLYLRRRL